MTSDKLLLLLLILKFFASCYNLNDTLAECMQEVCESDIRLIYWRCVSASASYTR